MHFRNHQRKENGLGFLKRSIKEKKEELPYNRTFKPSTKTTHPPQDTLSRPDPNHVLRGFEGGVKEKKEEFVSLSFSVSKAPPWHRWSYRGGCGVPF